MNPHYWKELLAEATSRSLDGAVYLYLSNEPLIMCNERSPLLY